MTIVVAIDGPAASGKGTIARRLAATFGFAHLDTGLLYRAVAAAVLAEGGAPSDPLAATAAARALTLDAIDEAALRGADIAKAASHVAPIAEVRAALLAHQRDFAAHPPGGARGSILDGRDIGTVICPDADVKLFVVASAEVRAERRRVELAARGAPLSYEEVLEDVRRRDARDAARAEAPLAQAADAHLLDTTLLDIDAAVEKAAALVRPLIMLG